jgi:ribonuclease R
MSIDQEQILEFLSNEAARPLKVRELARKMEITDEEYGTFRRTIREMLRNGLLVKMKRGKIGLPAKSDLVVGRLVSGRSGYGFVVPEDKSDDVYVRDENMGYSLHGYTVVVRLLGRRRGPARLFPIGRPWTWVRKAKSSRCLAIRTSREWTFCV